MRVDADEVRQHLDAIVAVGRENAVVATLDVNLVVERCMVSVGRLEVEVDFVAEVVDDEATEMSRGGGGACDNPFDLFGPCCLSDVSLHPSCCLY